MHQGPLHARKRVAQENVQKKKRLLASDVVELNVAVTLATVQSFVSQVCIENPRKSKYMNRARVYVDLCNKHN